MKAESSLKLIVRTPRELVAELTLQSVRFPTDTGWVGLRRGCEAAVYAIEPGLILAQTPQQMIFLATGGGLLRCEGQVAILLTPVVVSGNDAQQVRTRLERALVEPTADVELRHAIARLETGILHELRGGTSASSPHTGFKR